MTRCSLSSQVPLSPSCFLAVERFCVLKESFTCAAPTTQSPSRDLWLTPPSLSISYFLPRCSPIAHFPLVVSSIPPFILQPLPIPVHIIVFLPLPPEPLATLSSLVLSLLLSVPLEWWIWRKFWMFWSSSLRSRWPSRGITLAYWWSPANPVQSKPSCWPMTSQCQSWTRRRPWIVTSSSLTTRHFFSQWSAWCRKTGSSDWLWEQWRMGWPSTLLTPRGTASRAGSMIGWSEEWVRYLPYFCCCVLFTISTAACMHVCTICTPVQAL